MTWLAPMQHFQDVTVVPLGKMQRNVAWGGAIWPDYDTQLGARHLRSGVPADRIPDAPRKTEYMQGPAVWGGTLDRQFGHLIAENLSRLPQSLQTHPNDTYLFLVEKGVSPTTLPDWIWQILDWFGLPRANVHIVTKALCVKDLYVAPQGEQLGKFTMQDIYLDVLDRNHARNALAVIPSDVTYVSRVGYAATGHGGHAGESYLTSVLAKLGVNVIDPAKMTILDQLATYAGAKTLVFAEGSAQYGRNLLGRIGHDVHVLRRRKGRDTGKEHLLARCNTVTFHPSVAGTLVARAANGMIYYNRNLALYNLDVVFALFASLGYDLPSHWDHAAYNHAACTDIVGWLENCPTTPEQFIINVDTVTAAGFDLDSADALARDAAPH